MNTQQYHELFKDAFPGQQYALNLYPGTHEIDPGFTPISSRPFRDKSGVPTGDPAAHKHDDLLMLGDEAGEPNLLATAWLRGIGVADEIARGWHCIVKFSLAGPASITDSQVDLALDQIQNGIEQAKADLAALKAAETA